MRNFARLRHRAGDRDWPASLRKVVEQVRYPSGPRRGSDEEDLCRRRLTRATWR
jgi:hypothetical protein